jgi:histone deacetylase 1/2
LSESSATSIPQTYWSLCVSATADLWHRRLGHPTSCILNLLVSKNKIVCTSRHSLAQCQACPLGTSSRLLLRPRGHKTTAPLDLIFSDIRGLATMFLFYGFHYFIIFIDAHTKHIWFYPIVVKSYVFFTFYRFQTIVER